MLTHAQSLRSERASGTRTESVLIPEFVYVYGVYTDLNGFVYGEKNVLSVLKWSHHGE